MGVTTKLFVADGEGRWRRLALNTGYLASHGALPLTEFAGQTITVAFAHVEVRGQLVVKLFRVERARWRFDSAGHFDFGFFEAESRARCWPRSFVEIVDGRQFSAAEIEALRLYIGLQIKTSDWGIPAKRRRTQNRVGR